MSFVTLTDLLPFVGAMIDLKMLCNLDCALCSHQFRDSFFHFAIDKFICNELVVIEDEYGYDFNVHCGFNLQFHWIMLRGIKCTSIYLKGSSFFRFTVNQIQCFCSFIQLNNAHTFKQISIPVDEDLLIAVCCCVEIIHCQALALIRFQPSVLNSEIFAKVLNCFTGLTWLDLPFNAQFSENSFRILFPSTVGVPSKLRYLSLGTLEFVGKYISQQQHCAPLRHLLVQVIQSQKEWNYITSCCHQLVTLAIEEILSFLYISTSALIAVATQCTSNLKHLQLSTMHVNDTSALAFAINCPNLTHVDFSHSSITGAGLRSVAKHCRQLVRVLCAYTKIDDTSIKSVVILCTRLRVLHVKGCAELTDVSCHYVAWYCKDLIYVCFACCNGLTDKHTEALIASNPLLRNVTHELNCGSSFGDLKEYFPELVKM